MIIRLSHRLAKRIKVASLPKRELHANPWADWTARDFTFDRLRLLMVTHTVSLYTVLVPARGITNEARLRHVVADQLNAALARDGFTGLYTFRIAPETDDVQFASALNRSVTGSMNDFVNCVKFVLECPGATLEVGAAKLNEMPMSALKGTDGRKYAVPRECFSRTEELAEVMRAGVTTNAAAAQGSPDVPS